MNFLSTGEKIKRARIYKGITLKELCQSDISISKMSCIENDKIKADVWILEMVAKRLDLDLNYLLYDDVMELESSVKEYQAKDDLSNEECLAIKERIDYCLIKEYKDLALEFLHILFSEYTRKRKFEDIKELISIYNDFSNLTQVQEQFYYQDLAKYFLARRNYNDAITYFNRAKNHVDNYTDVSKMEAYAENSFFLAMTYYLNGQFEKADEILTSLIILEDTIESKEKMMLVNGLLYATRMKQGKGLQINKDIFERIEDKSTLIYSKVALIIAKVYIDISRKDMALDTIKFVKDNVTKKNLHAYTEILITMVRMLLELDEIVLAKQICEKALEISISLNNYFLIEKSYLYKARISRAERSLIQWEMNMNLATDILMKFACADEKRERYIEMAEMYHVIGELRESLKYLTLSMNLERNNDI
ncbi:MAG: helix-turn-helix domain-containing protein [Sarcina sp.]